MTRCKACMYSVKHRGGEFECRRRAPVPGHSTAITEKAAEIHVKPVLCPEDYCCGEGEPKR